MVKVSISIHIVCQSSEFVIQMIFVFITLIAEYKGMLETVQGYFAFCNLHYNSKYNSTFIKSII